MTLLIDLLRFPHGRTHSKVKPKATIGATNNDDGVIPLANIVASAPTKDELRATRVKIRHLSELASDSGDDGDNDDNDAELSDHAAKAPIQPKHAKHVVKKPLPVKRSDGVTASAGE